MNTTENNKIIAEFLGESKQPYEFSQFGYMTLSGDWKDTFFVEQLKFHSNWNWLIEVVEKIESLKFSVLIGKNTCVIEQTFGKTSLNLGVIRGKDKIEAVYNACAEFINWYNQQNQQPCNQPK